MSSEDQPFVEFRVDPERYRHWRVGCDGPVATVTMDVDEAGGLVPGYELKLNSYDLGVDIELYDIVQRLRFEHPEVTDGGADQRQGQDLLRRGQHPHAGRRRRTAGKVNFCKFTNETRNGIEDASANSGQVWIAALNGTASGGGYELALACEHIMLVDDRSSAVALPELPLLGVLPGTGGLTRVVDKRHVRRDLADYFSTRPEGLGGKKAVAWRLVDEAVPRPAWDRPWPSGPASWPPHRTGARPKPKASSSARPGQGPVSRRDRLPVRHRPGWTGPARIAEHHRQRAGRRRPRKTPAGSSEQGPDFWTLAVTRELDDLILDLRTNEPELGTWVLRTTGDAGTGSWPTTSSCSTSKDDWLAAEITHYLKRTLKRLDVTSRSLIALIEPGSCFAGSLLELALAADRSFQLDARRGVRGTRTRTPEPAATITVGPMNLGPLPMGNGLTRLQTRFLGDDDALAAAEKSRGRAAEPPQTPSRRAWSPSPPTISTGTTRCASRSRSGPASARTRYRHGGRTTGSPARRPWRRRSSGGSPPGRTGSSTAPTPPGRTERCASSAPASDAEFDRRRV